MAIAHEVGRKIEHARVRAAGVTNLARIAVAAERIAVAAEAIAEAFSVKVKKPSPPASVTLEEDDVVEDLP